MKRVSPVYRLREEPGPAEAAGGRRMAERGQEAGPAGDTAPAQVATVQTAISPADDLFAAVRDVLRRLLVTPMKAAEIAAALDVSAAQARTWLQRLVDEGALERKKRGSYVIKQSRLFE
jgi:hypothetical protein